MTSGKRSHRSQALVLGALLGSTALLAACSGSTSSNASPSMTAEATTAAPTTQAPTSSPGGPCNADVIAGALPNGARVVSFDCANVSGTEWAAVKVNPGPTVFFLQWNDGSWDVSTADEVCGTASAGLPEKLLAYCGSGQSSEGSYDSEGDDGMGGQTEDSSASPS